MSRDPQTERLFRELIEDLQSSNMTDITEQYLKDATEAYKSFDSEPVVYRRLERLRYMLQVELWNGQDR